MNKIYFIDQEVFEKSKICLRFKRKIDILGPLMPQDEDVTQEVPEGWEKRTSRSTGMVYYLNIFTKGRKWKTEDIFH